MVNCSSCVSFCISYPLSGKNKTLWHFHQAVHTPYMYFSLYVPCLVRVKPHFRHFHQAVHTCNTCMALLLSLYCCTIVCVSLYVVHETSGIARSTVNVSSLIQVLCTVPPFIIMVQLLYDISNQCRIIVFKFTVNCG